MSNKISNKVLVINNIPTPYRIPLFNELNKELKKGGLELKVLFGAHGYPGRKWSVNLALCEFGYKILASRRLSLFGPEKVMFTYRGLYRIIRDEKPLVVITNGFSMATTKLWLLSWFMKVRYIIWSGAIENRRRATSWVRKLHRRLMIRRASGFVAYGTKAKEYLISLGASPEGVELGINTVDVDFFMKETEKHRALMGGGANKKNLLYVGYLVKRKSVDRLLKAVKILAGEREDFVLKIVGDGPEKQSLAKQVEDMGIAKFVSFEGYKQKEELIRYYAEADFFLFPSDYDIWGLVLVEAMAAGLPCIVSNHAGAVHDLVENGVSGFIVKSGNFCEIAQKLRIFMEDYPLAQKMGEEAKRAIINKATLKASVHGFCRAIEKTIIRPF